jgi:hypothetical protein
MIDQKISGKDRKAFGEAIEQSHAMGLMLCAIYNPAFKHFFVELKTPDTQEVMGQAMGDDAESAFLACILDARRKMNILGVQRYEFQETKPLVLVP